MSALYGRQDPLLDSGRFFRLLRQAHDAEVADVRKLGEDDYEVIGRRTDSGPVPGIAPSAATDAAGGEDQPAPATNAEAASVRGGLRFRRGTRLGSASAVIPMIGVVNLEEEAPAAEPVKKGRAPARKKAAKPAPEASEEAEAPPPKKKAAPRTRAKKKAEE